MSRTRPGQGIRRPDRSPPRPLPPGPRTGAERPAHPPPRWSPGRAGSLAAALLASCSARVHQAGDRCRFAAQVASALRCGKPGGDADATLRQRAALGRVAVSQYAALRNITRLRRVHNPPGRGRLVRVNGRAPRGGRFRHRRAGLAGVLDRVRSRVVVRATRPMVAALTFFRAAAASCSRRSMLVAVIEPKVTAAALLARPGLRLLEDAAPGARTDQPRDCAVPRSHVVTSVS